MHSLKVVSTELVYFDERRSELLRKHRGQFALIKNRQLIGVYPTATQAHAAALSRFPFSNFLVKQITDERSSDAVGPSDMTSWEIEVLTRERDALAALLKMRRGLD